MGGDQRSGLRIDHVSGDPDEECAMGDVARVEVFDLLHPNSGDAFGVTTERTPIGVCAEQRFAETNGAQGLVVVEAGDQPCVRLPLELGEVAGPHGGIPNHLGQQRQQGVQVSAKHRGASSSGTHRHLDG